MMSDEQRVPGAADDRGEKRKCDDFTALYPMDSATTTPTPQAPAPPRILNDPSGKRMCLFLILLVKLIS